MLVSLTIENIAVIERASISFDSGLTVLTGETGAGKSIVIDSLNAVLGERIRRDLVRAGSEKASVSALFRDISGAALEALAEMGMEPDEDGSLLIQRSLTADGKGACHINGRPATVSMLRTVGRLLVNIHGQHENQALLAPERHVEYLDRLGGLLPLRASYEDAYRRYCAIRRQLKAADMDEALKARRLDLLRYQIDEIEEAALRPGEEEALAARRAVGRNAERIASSLQNAKAILSGDEDSAGILSALSEAVTAVQDAGRYMEELRTLSGRVESLYYELEECAEELRDQAQRLDFDEGELEQVENRLDLLRRLSDKYGGSEEAVLAYLEQARQELDAIEMSDEHVARLQEQLAAARDETIAAAEKLTEARRQAARRFSEDVGRELAFLDMPGVTLEVSIEPVPLTAIGGDKVEFRIAANPGEPARSISRVASGGELSRIMLAMKSVLADIDDIDTLIYDEVDAGISGRAARKVGLKLHQTARSRQILCVTHLAQIASQADHHLLIAKQVRQGRTYTEVTSLDGEGRELELARIIGGEATEAARTAAREMLAARSGEIR